MLSSHIELTKPGITLFVAITAVAGYLVAASQTVAGSQAVAPAAALHLVLGVVLATAGALALNQYIERGPDALMARTRGRPIPSGRIPPLHAAIFGALLLAAGIGHLWFWLGWLPALLTALSALLYDAAYTPLKLRSPLATPVGAVPGALPALIGWTAHTGDVGVRGMTLFGILFLWQFIHVLALGWNLRDDYERAGFQIIPPGSAGLISALMVGHATALLVLSIVPAVLGMAGLLYLIGAILLGAAMIAATISFQRDPTRQRCNRIFVGSLAYHPMLLGLLVAGAMSDASAQEAQRPRARDLGIEVGVFQPGAHNAITDVEGVLVGHATVVSGDDVRTGVTAIRPHGGNVYFDRVPAAMHVGNGFGKLLGVTQVRELGELETPVLLTCTLCVWKAADAMVEWALGLENMERVRSINPVVGETNDGGLNDIRNRPITPGHVRAALESATAGPVEEGAVGAGTGTTAFGWKGGIGTSSRVLPESLGGYTLGVLVQSNFGGILTIAGAPVGRELGRYAFQRQVEGRGDSSGGGNPSGGGATPANTRAREGPASPDAHESAGGADDPGGP